MVDNEVDVNFGINFYPTLLAGLTPMFGQGIGSALAVRIGISIRSKDRVERCCLDWHRRPIKTLVGICCQGIRRS